MYGKLKKIASVESDKHIFIHDIPMHGRENFFLLVLFEMIKSSPFDRELSRLKFSESEEDSGKENKKTTQHETKEVVSNANSKVRI